MQKRVILEKIQSAEAFPALSRLLFNEEVMGRNLGRVFTQEEAEQYFNHVLEYNRANENAGTYGVFLADSRAFIGVGSLWAEGESAEIEYMVLPAYWGRGYGTEIAGALMELARRHPQVTEVTGFMDPGNLPSKRVLLKNGFSFAGTREVEEDHSVVEIYTNSSIKRFDRFIELR